MAPADGGSEQVSAWQVLAGHGVQDISSLDAIAKRRQEVEAALEQICCELAEVASDTTVPALQRIRRLRSKPQQGHKSLYECLNQLTHYWYCCVAVQHLLELGCTSIRMRPTGADNQADGRGAFDVTATHPSGAEIVAEVFCVSQSLWQAKVSATIGKLKAWPTDALRAVFYNIECRPGYRSKSAGLQFFGISTPKGDVQLVCNTDERSL